MLAAPGFGALLLQVGKALPLAIISVGAVVFTLAVTISAGELHGSRSEGGEARPAATSLESAPPSSQLAGFEDLSLEIADPGPRPLVFLVASAAEAETWLSRLEAANLVSAAIGEPERAMTVLIAASPLEEAAIRDGVHLENQVRIEHGMRVTVVIDLR